MPISELHTPLPIAYANFFYIYQSDPWLARPLYVDFEIDVIAKSQAESVCFFLRGFMRDSERLYITCSLYNFWAQ